MKKCLAFGILCCVILTGCGDSGVSQEEYDSVVAERDELQERVSYLENELSNQNNGLSENFSEETTEQSTEPRETANSMENTESGIEILAEYTLPDEIGWYTRHFMIIQNNTNETVDISTSSLAYAQDGTMVGADDAEFNALGAGCVSVLYEAFEVDTEIDYYETDLIVSKSKYYNSVIQDLSYVQNDVENGAVFQVTNEGEDAAEFVEGYALFFSGDELVGYESTYFTDDDSEIKSGKTISKQLTSYNDFDRIEFYLTGRK